MAITIVFRFQSEKRKRPTTIRPFDGKGLANRIVVFASNRWSFGARTVYTRSALLDKVLHSRCDIRAHPNRYTAVVCRSPCSDPKWSIDSSLRAFWSGVFKHDRAYHFSRTLPSFAIRLSMRNEENGSRTPRVGSPCPRAIALFRARRSWPGRTADFCRQRRTSSAHNFRVAIYTG